MFESDFHYFKGQGKARLYHGSRSGLELPIIHDHPRARATCDFGKGFYLGSNNWQTRALASDGDNPMFYEFSMSLENLNCVFITGRAWAFLVAMNRRIIKIDNHPDLCDFLAESICDCDVIVGPIADDKMFLSLKMFYEDILPDKGLIDCLYALPDCNLGIQYTLKTEMACKNANIISERKMLPEECAQLAYESETRNANMQEMVKRIHAKTRKEGSLFTELIDNFEREHTRHSLSPSL